MGRPSSSLPNPLANQPPGRAPGNSRQLAPSSSLRNTYWRVCSGRWLQSASCEPISQLPASVSHMRITDMPVKPGSLSGSISRTSLQVRPLSSVQR